MKILTFVAILLLTSCQGDIKGKFTGGDEFSRPRISAKDYKNNLSEHEIKLLLATGKVLNQKANEMGTAFYIGLYNGSPYFITNNHVLSSDLECNQTTITLATKELKSKIFRCDRIISTTSFKDGSDVTLFSVKKRDDLSLVGRELKLANSRPLPGDKLSIIGFGSQRESKGQFNPTISNDDDCIYYDSGRNLEIDFVSVDDAFATGCDTSTGDSGSAIMNRQTGEVVALLFGFVKSKTFRPTSGAIQNLVHQSTDLLWSHASLGISISEVIYRLDL